MEAIQESQKILFSASDDGLIKMWSLGTKDCIRSFNSHVGQVQDLKMVLVDPKTIESANEDESSSKPKLQRVMDTNEGQLQVFKNVNDNNSLNIQSPNDTKLNQFLDDNNNSNEFVPMLVSGALDNTVKQWDVNTGNCLRTLFGHIEG